ncbi:hypothetical protein CALVIDRAFT_528421 [Calocera viscosa TUFC12733]|uniref:Uncharacterized protein n=1 Tax=Calocera viscosa (strain TUFC12733) TaxID=1330018 RepID=A0A167KVM1_CALVF|nr:hypothetical protein CALVIDRAFT_528421 [Calocera viscosa TUFC12733]
MSGAEIAVAVVEGGSVLMELGKMAYNSMNPSGLAQTNAELYGNLPQVANNAHKAGVPVSKIEKVMQKSNRNLENRKKEEVLEAGNKRHSKRLQSFRTWFSSMGAHSTLGSSTTALKVLTSNKILEAKRDEIRASDSFRSH